MDLSFLLCYRLSPLLNAAPQSVIAPIGALVLGMFLVVCRVRVITETNDFRVLSSLESYVRPFLARRDFTMPGYYCTCASRKG